MGFIRSLVAGTHCDAKGKTPGLCLSAKFSRDREALSHLAVHLSEIAHVVEPVGSKLSLLKDDPDNRILECALSGKADAIVTGDKEMLALKHFKGIRIISLREYLES